MIAQRENSPQPPLTNPRHLAAALTAASYQATRMAVSARLAPADRDDLRQSLLLAVVQKAPGYDPRRGAWTTFVCLVLRHAAQELGDRMARDYGRAFVPLETAETAVTSDPFHAVDLRMDLERFAASLPDDLLRVWCLRTTAPPVSAMKGSGRSRAGFHRALRELRMQARIADLESSGGRETDAKHDRYISRQKGSAQRLREPLDPSGDRRDQPDRRERPEGWPRHRQIACPVSAGATACP